MVNILRLTVAYLNATINVKPETQNRRLEPTGLAKPGETRGLTGTGPGLACQESAGRVFGRFKNRTDLFLRSKPGPLVGYLDPLLTLSQMLNRSRVVKWLTVVQHPILEFDKYTGNEYILIISEHKSTNFGSPVLFNLSAE